MATAAPPPHPTAKAFFDALDLKTNSKRQCDALKRRSQSLGWRNRYSQEAYYPISLQMESSIMPFSVRQVQRGEIEDTYGTGATVWPAAMVLVKYLEKNRNLLTQKRVVDLGSGTGITSIAAAILGAAHVICTDGQDKVVQLAMDNVRHAAQQLSSKDVMSQQRDSFRDDKALQYTSSSSSSSSSSCTIIQNCPVVVQNYWWGSVMMDPMKEKDCQVILVADCVLPKLYPIDPLVQAIDELLPSSDNDEHQTMAILSYEHRYYPDYDPRDKFRALATERGLIVETIPSVQYDPIYSVDDIEIWHVRRGRNT